MTAGSGSPDQPGPPWPGAPHGARLDASGVICLPVPGQLDVWNHVTDLLRRPLSALRSTGSTLRALPSRLRPTRRRTLVVASATTALVLVGGTVAVAQAHKTITLDVDGRTVVVSTFAGSVEGVLADNGVVVGARDVVAPGPDDVLSDGDEVVVRHAHSVTVLTDGVEQVVWTTALSADAALDVLAARGQDVRLVASRSASTGRADLPLRLHLDGSVDVAVDGATRTVSGARTLDEVLAQLEVTVGELDRVQVLRVPAADGVTRLTVRVQRVAVQEVPELVAVPFAQVTEQTDDLYTGQSRTVTAGVDGELTRLLRIVTVDGVEESREVLSEAVSREPVTQVVQQGTASRPAPATGTVVTGDVWGQLAACESGGNPLAVSRNGLYYGLYQFSLPTWRAMGGSGLPTEASADEQTQRAQALQARSGWGQWPACAAKLGLL